VASGVYEEHDLADFQVKLCSQECRINEKALRETQTLRARRSPPIRTESAMAVRQSQNSPRRRPPSRGRRTAKI